MKARLLYRDGVQWRTHGVVAATSPLRLSMGFAASIRRELYSRADLFLVINLIITCVLITLLIFG